MAAEQSGAYKLTAQMSVIDTVATSGDSVALPKCTGNVGQGSATPGQVGFISFGVNNSLNTLQLFGQTPDTINDVANDRNRRAHRTRARLDRVAHCLHAIHERRRLVCASDRLAGWADR